MKNDNLSREWIDLAPAWIKEARKGRNATRNGLLDKPMLEACGNIKGLNVLDCGCGEGRFCRILTDRGAAYVVGLDLCEPLVEAARELESGRDEYRVADAQDIGFLQDETFDLAVSYLNQCDLPDFNANNREVFDRYFDEGERHWKMMGCAFTNFHRSLCTYTRGFLDAGFSIEGIVEPTVTEEQLALFPELDDELRVPNFIIYALKKP